MREQIDVLRRTAAIAIPLILIWGVVDHWCYIHGVRAWFAWGVRALVVAYLVVFWRLSRPARPLSDSTAVKLGFAAHLVVGVSFIVLDDITQQYHSNYPTGMILLFITIAMVPWSAKTTRDLVLLLSYLFIIASLVHMRAGTDLLEHCFGFLRQDGLKQYVPKQSPGDESTGIINNMCFAYGAAFLCWIAARLKDPNQSTTTPVKELLGILVQLIFLLLAVFLVMSPEFTLHWITICFGLYHLFFIVKRLHSKL